ncbi:Hypothetical_protein [Hexamita inflata]|uniref:Hypothetical_protein n=1 Tax=Hexamita inflata TaxID=28002 RepID=A0ABP1I7H3_9EUKA
MQNEQELVNCLSKLLQIKNSAKHVSFYVLMLPDHLHTRLFTEVALLLESTEIIVRDQFRLLTLKYFVNNSLCYLTENINTTYNLTENCPRTQSKESILFQNKFANCLQQTLNINTSDNKILCQNVLHYFNDNGSKQFWRKMGELIPEKTTVQLREYFQNSFRRFMHQEYLNKEDKVILLELIKQMKDKKPAQIADEFMDTVKDRNYFKRNVVMYIINMKKQ